MWLLAVQQMARVKDLVLCLGKHLLNSLELAYTAEPVPAALQYENGAGDRVKIAFEWMFPGERCAAALDPGMKHSIGIGMIAGQATAEIAGLETALQLPDGFSCTFFRLNDGCFSNNGCYGRMLRSIEHGYTCTLAMSVEDWMRYGEVTKDGWNDLFNLASVVRETARFERTLRISMAGTRVCDEAAAGGSRENLRKVFPIAYGTESLMNQQDGAARRGMLPVMHFHCFAIDVEHRRAGDELFAQRTPSQSMDFFSSSQA